MLSVTVEQDAVYEVQCGTYNSCYIALVRNDVIDDYGLPKLLWTFQCGNERSLDAAAHWFAVRRGLWNEWGQLVEKKGARALSEHIEALMAADPIGEVYYTLIQRDDDPKILNLGEMLMTNEGLRSHILYKHRFSTPGKRKRFFKWLEPNISNGSPEQLLNIGVKQGSEALAKMLERIARGDQVNLAIEETA